MTPDFDDINIPNLSNARSAARYYLCTRMGEVKKMTTPKIVH